MPYAPITPTDSIAAAPVAVAVQPHAGEDHECSFDEAPTTVAIPGVHTGVVPYTRGLEAIPRHPLPGYDTGVMSMVLAVFLIIAVNFHHFSSYLKVVWQNLFSVRARDNVFDEHTVGEERVMISLLLLTCLCEGIMAYAALQTAGIPTPGSFVSIASLSGAAILLYLFQLIAYQTVGFAFTGNAGRTQWIRGFNASQSFLGIFMAVPALLSLFNPNISGTLCAIGLLLYITSRVIFIIKGFRIFYENVFSLFYFILYLCSLEIIPILVCGRGIFFLCNFM